MASSSAITLYPYQQAWLKDHTRFKIGMFARQTGKTFTSTLEIVDDCIQAEVQGRRKRWVILSRGERQAKEAMDEGVKRHLQAFSIAFTALDYDYEGSHKALEVSLPGGSRITALPANPDTARGFSASVFLDEFAFHQDSRAIWKALFPVISAGHQLRVVSTPNGKGNKFYDLMTADDPTWSRHVVDIHEAVRQGLPRDIDGLRRALNDPDAWAQEFELQWLDEASAWLSYDLINSCEDHTAGDPSRYEETSGMCFVGMDIARRRDYTVIWVVERMGDVFWTREVVRLQRASFAAQEAELARIMRYYRVARLCMDQTGMGEVLVENARRAYGSRVEGVLFSGAVKQDLATTLKQKFEDRQVRIPIAQAIRDSHHAVKKIMTSAGNPRFDAERSELGHADEFWAHALAIHAASNPVHIEFESVGGRESEGAWGDDTPSLALSGLHHWSLK
jgi:phage FluMu gp28-like protein